MTEKNISVMSFQVYSEVAMKSFAKKKAAMCCALEKKRMSDALRYCDYGTTSSEERSACYKAVAKDSGLRSKTCILM
jgi:hypothetical protein